MKRNRCIEMSCEHFEPRTRADREQETSAHVGLGLTLADTGRATEALPLVERAVASVENASGLTTGALARRSSLKASC